MNILQKRLPSPETNTPIRNRNIEDLSLGWIDDGEENYFTCYISSDQDQLDKEACYEERTSFLIHDKKSGKCLNSQKIGLKIF